MKVSCKTCKTEFEKSEREINRTSNNFCSHSCSAKFTNVNRAETRHWCLQCNKPLSNKQKFCSSECFQIYRQKNKIHKWLSGELPGHYPNGQIAVYAKCYILERDGYRCRKCGWNEIHPKTGKPPLQINHIDGDVTNSVPANLESVCPNCHALTPNWGGHNRGNGRESKGFKRR